MSHALVARAFATCAALVLALPGLASGQFAVSDPEALFVPGDQIPLSEFRSVTSGVPVTLNVRSQILRWLVNQPAPIEVAVSTDGSTSIDVAPDSVSVQTGTVTYTPGADAFVVVVSDALVNNFPIVTHWDPSANPLGGYDPDGAGPLQPAPRGGQAPDATGGIGTIDYVEDPPDSGNYKTKASGNGFNQDGAIHSDAFGTFEFATHRYALFSDGTETTPDKDGEIADADVPSYEHYSGENWASNAVTDLAAIKLSDESRAWTSLPIGHRNPTPAFDPFAPQTQQLQAGIPVIQIVHAYIVDYDDPTIPGAEASLATLLVPPLWTPTPTQDYAVLFNAFYGIHASTFMSMREVFLRTLGELFDEGKPIVGILSNGGGAGTSLTQQGSIYPNITQLFDEATTLLSIDRAKVVTTGGSRGGTSSLSLAASPGWSPFTAPYVVAGNPTTHPGDALTNHVNPTYGLVQASADGFTGYQGAWIPGWTGPGGQTAQQILSDVIFGTTAFGSLDSTLANASPTFLGALLAKGSKVVLRVGTHDYSRSMSHTTAYYEALLATGVPARMEVGYRFGHGSTQGTQPDEAELLRRVITGSSPVFEAGTFHFHPTDDASEASLLGTEFDPPHAPMVLEAPPVTALGQLHTYTVSGPPGTAYSVWVAPIDFADWTIQVLTYTGSPIFAFGGTLPTAAPGVSSTSSTHQLSVPVDAFFIGVWTWGIGYTVPGFPNKLTAGESAAPPTAAGGADLWDLAPVSFWGDIAAYAQDPTNLDLGVHSTPANTVNWATVSRTSGLSTDIDFN